MARLVPVGHRSVYCGIGLPQTWSRGERAASATSGMPGLYSGEKEIDKKSRTKGKHGLSGTQRSTLR